MSLQMAPNLALSRQTSMQQPSQLAKQNPSDISAESLVTYVYEANISGTLSEITATWSKNLTSHSLCITVHNLLDKMPQKSTCKIELQGRLFLSRKGLKSIDVDSKRVDIFWDFRSAKFPATGSPEPHSDYYAALVCNGELVLLLGDNEDEAIRRTMSRPPLIEPTILHKFENVFGNDYFCTQALLDDGMVKHEIEIESSLSGPGDPEMWIKMDGRVLIRVLNLNWSFRGNETVLVNNSTVQVFWDVHGWLFSGPGTRGHGLFIFKPGLLDCIADCDLPCNASALNFCYVLYACKME
ncbi:hypothetical protein Ancab_024892 [Ancistrocladus abbreviatus]